MNLHPNIEGMPKRRTSRCLEIRSSSEEPDVLFCLLYMKDQVMERKLFILFILLPSSTGIVPLVQSVTPKIYLFQHNKNWNDALTYCRTNHTDLVTIKNPADMNKLQAEAQEHQFSFSAWIGLYKIFNDWRWSFNNESLGSWRLWASGEPTNGNQECGSIYIQNWWDLPCTASCPFVCYDDGLVDDDRYIYYDNRTTWYEAQAFCRQQHSNLVSTRDDAELLIVVGKFSPYTTYIWIGLYRNSWTWSDETKVSTINWAPGEPDNYPGEDCAYVEDGLIFGTQCSVTKPFFCYSAIRQQIIRMKVQSDQDVNDPVVQAAILEQIQQNLKDHGIANVTVKFRKQPGGAVFHKLEKNKTAVENKSREACEP